MSGLYQKALAVLQERPPLKLVKQEYPTAAFDESAGGLAAEGISAEDRKEILAQIDSIVDRRRIEVQPGIFHYKPKRRGFVLPLIINLAAVMVTLAGVFLFYYFFNQDEQTITANPTAILTAESKVIEALKQDSEQKLAQKNQEISSIQQRLAAMNQEWDRYKLETEAQIRQREAELRVSLEQEMVSARRQLQSQGLSEQAIQRRLQQLEEQKRDELERRLTSVKEEAEAELARRQSALNSQIEEIEQSLQRARAERSRIEVELNRRVAELEQQLEEKEQSLKSEHSSAVAELERLRGERQREELVMDQILASYDRVSENLANFNYQEARGGLDRLDEYLDQEAIATLPAVKRRLHTEQFIIGSLRRLIQAQEDGEKRSESLNTAAGLLASVSEIVEQAENERLAGNVLAAQELYFSAMEKIPSIKLSYAKLQEIEELALELEEQRLAELLAAGDRHYQAGRLQQAVDTYSQALAAIIEDSRAVDRMMSRLLEAGFRLYDREESERELADLSARLEELEARREDARARLRTAQERYAFFTEAASAEGTEAGIESTELQESLFELLEAKLLVKEIVSSEPVRSKYPELYRDLDRYFEAFGREQRRVGRSAALEDLIQALEALLAKEERADLSETIDSLAEPAERDCLRQLLGTLQKLVD